jgi:para-nitrobenzyl esterase
MNKFAFLLILPLLILPVNFHSTGNAPRVITEGGKIEGYAKDGINVFMGVPFAAPPILELRWKPPQPVVKWKGVRKCLTPPPSAMQDKPAPFMMWSKEFMAPEEPLSEDCLYLNIWSPSVNKRSRLPVIVWIHGGAFTGGSGTVPLYDGTEIAKNGVVFITINYRLGIFGFLALPDLSAESPMGTSGNYGILDQIEALRWISRNIEHFGGNPGNVTIAGQSAGSFSVNALMVSPLAKGLFHRAIGESGGMFATSGGIVTNLKSAEEAGLKYSSHAGVSSLKDLRLMPAPELMKIQGRWGITIDNKVIHSAREAFESGMQNDVPLLTGSNADEGIMFGQPQNAEIFRANASKTYGERAEEFLSLFPAGNDQEAAQSQKIISQMYFGWQNYFWAKTQAVNGKNKSWLYFFKRVPPGEPNYGAFHSAEFGYVLKTLKFWNRPFKEWDYQLSEIMSSYWVNFARSGDPNCEGLPLWPSFDPQRPVVIQFGDEVKPVDLPYRKQLGFFDSINR